MRVLKFIVEDQVIRQDPNCDFDNLFPGTEGYLKTEFSFSPSWKNCVKVAGFWRNGRECKPQILEDGKTCMIPAEALKSNQFSIRVFGKRDNFKIGTGAIIVNQTGGCVND